MAYRILFVLLEGDDDVRFFEEVIRPICAEQYDHIHLWSYSQQKKEKANDFLNSIRAMQTEGLADSLFVADLDQSPCVTHRKNRVFSTFRTLESNVGAAARSHSPTEVLIVCKEIESWYLAGLTDASCRRIGISTSFSNTDDISKEQFYEIMPSGFKTRTAFMEAILQAFDLETARSRNRSFQYFMRKHGSGG